MNYVPLGTRVLVERKEEQSTTASGIIIPDNATEKQTEGTVVALNKNDAEKGEVKVGDTVVFGKFAGTEINLDGKEYVVLNMADILLKKQ